MRPRIFIGSSRESLEFAYAVQENLENNADITVWTQGVFELSKHTVNSLVGALDQFDFGVFVFAEEDIVRLSDAPESIVRDNLAFELGLFVGRLGKDRNFLIVPKGFENSHIPTDVSGITPGTFDSNGTDGNIRAAVEPVCSRILKSLQKKGVFRPATEAVPTSTMRPSFLTPDSPLLNQLINSAIQTVCRAIALPQTAEASRIRVFIFRKESDQLVCTHYWAPNPVREMVGRLRFSINSDVARRVAVVRCVISEEITRTEVSPLPKGPHGMGEGISDELSFVLAAPIRNPDGTIWGTVDFDASTEAAQKLLSDEVSNAAMLQLAQHLQIIFSMRA
jgi:hypothetical protein